MDQLPHWGGSYHGKGGVHPYLTFAIAGKIFESSFLAVLRMYLAYTYYRDVSPWWGF